MDDLLRLLGLIERDLEASDARIVIGGTPSDDPRDVVVALEPGWRLVARFDTPVEDRETVATRIRALFETFRDTGSTHARGAARLGLGARSAERQRERIDDELTDTLALLADRTRAHTVMVIDERSPIFWGSSSELALHDVDEALQLAELHARRGDTLARQLASVPSPPGPGLHLEDTRSDGRLLGQLRRRQQELESGPGETPWPRLIATADAVSLVRNQDDQAPRGRKLVQRDDLGVWARSFAGLYWLVQVFEGRFSELAVERPSVRALPIIERLVLSLPPLDPEPKGGTLLAFLRSVD